MQYIDTSASLSRDLRAAVADLETVSPQAGLWRLGLIGTAFLIFVGLAWTTPHPFLFAGYTAIAGVFYAFWFMCTHDAVHHTLTGWVTFEECISRLISWPMLWPFGTYAQLHRLHHGWNGVDLRDPERVQWTVSDYQQASPLLRWYVHHQWAIDLLGLGGIGLIVKTVLSALRLRDHLPMLQRMLWLDAWGILLVQGLLVAIAIWHHQIGRYLLFWFILERTIGLIAQARDHLEHYGMWHPARGHQLTQIYSCRNLTTHPWVSWLMGGLDDHAVHHAFPNLPFNQLPNARRRIQQVLAQHHLPPMTQGRGYIEETLQLSTQPCLINSIDGTHLRLVG